MLVFGLIMAGTCFAQLPRWVVNLANDTLFVKVDNSIIEGRSNSSSLLWNMDGKLLYSTDNSILPFKDNVATVQMKGQPVIIGLIDQEGKYTALPNLSIAYDNPYYENGYILCLDDGKQAFYGKDGTRASFPEVAKFYPFHKGYAPFFTYTQLEKKKEPHYGYFKSDGTQVEYVLSDKGALKSVEPKDIDFVSGIGSNGKGVAVIKNKIYWFDADTEIFEPFLWGTEASEKKRHLNISGNYESYFLNLPSDTVIIYAKYGKNQFAELKFDKELMPVTFSFKDDVLDFIEKPSAGYDYESDLMSYGEPGDWGLSFKSKEVLPRQFEEVGIRYENKAFVKMSGKWGIIEIVPDMDYTLMLNKGEDIAFRHQKFETQIRMDLPAKISAKEARIDIPAKTGCLIDKTSRENKDTESGNFVTYDCVLNIPPSLPDTVTEITYEPVDVTCDGISLFGKPITVKAWHLKYYNVDPIESETSISDGVLSLTVNINVQRNVGEGDYPFEVRIEADSCSVAYEKISETRYKCLVSNLQEGNNNLNFFVKEKGCPPSIFPFEILYSKPVPKKRKKEEVVVRKKDPRLEL